MFPFSIGGRIRVKDKASLSAERIRDEFSSTLLVEGVGSESREADGAAFRLALLQYFSREHLMGVSSGIIRCYEKSGGLYVSYRLRFFPLYFLVTSLTLLCREAGIRFSPIPIPGEYFQFVWGWLVAGNILITLHEFRRFLRKCAAESTGRYYYWKDGSGSSATISGEAARDT